MMLYLHEIKSKKNVYYMERKSLLTSKSSLIFIFGAAAIVILFYVYSAQQEARFLVRHPKGVMGTSCTIAARSNLRTNAQVDAALQKTETRIREIEAKMSNWIDMSEISRFNRGESIQLSHDTLTILQTAFDSYQQTNGAFDITCRPLIELWTQHSETGEMPTDDEIQEARRESHWNQFEWRDSNIIRTEKAARVDLGGIAKGYAIDKAIAVQQEHGITSGMVDIGGDLRYFDSTGNKPLTVDIKHPFQEGTIAQIEIMNAAVCTSGNYARFIEINGKRYSHIIDPRTGIPSDIVPSVTILAENALQGDIWATAISVLGEDGLTLLPEGVEAFLILGSREESAYICTKGFQTKLVEPFPRELHLWVPSNQE